MEYDLLVIGAGSGGVRASRLAGSLGKKVALIEQRDIGGTCVNRGCVPKKLMLYASEYRSYFSDSPGFGWQITQQPFFNWSSFMQAKNKELKRLGEIYKSNLLKSNVDIYKSTAKFYDSHTVVLSDGQQLKAKNIIIATGAKPYMPQDLDGYGYCINSDDLLVMQDAPKSIVIYGGGYTAVEFANILHGLGVKVTLVYHKELFLRGFDLELRKSLSEAMVAKGINVLFNTIITQVRKLAQKEVHLSNGDIILADEVMLCLGRIPNTENLMLDKIGVPLGNKGEVSVDDYQRTSQEHIFAVGDVKHKIQLAPVAIEDAVCVIKTLYEGKPTKPDYSFLATAVFSQPELATVGYSEEQAKNLYEYLDVYRINFRPMRYSFIGATVKVLMKLLVDRLTDKVVGVHLLGEGSAELIQLFAVMLKAGVKKDDFNKTIAVHPTASEELVLSYKPSYSYHNGLSEA